MKLIKLICPNCGASLEVSEGEKQFFCEYCRTTTILDDEVIRIEHTIVDKNGEEKLKLFKGVGITSLIYFGIIMFVVIVIIVVVIFNIFKINDRVDKQMDNVQDQIYNSEEEFMNEYSKVEIQMFNGTFEMYSGTKSGFFVESLLDNVVTNNKTEKEHIITVVYDEKNTSNTDEIISIKRILEESKEYEVSLDYDSNGFVNKVTIE